MAARLPVESVPTITWNSHLILKLKHFRHVATPFEELGATDPFVAPESASGQDCVAAIYRLSQS